jgi:hypothetical protein
METFGVFASWELRFLSVFFFLRAVTGDSKKSTEGGVRNMFSLDN